MSGQSTVVTPIARLRSIAEAALSRVRKRSVASKQENNAGKRDDLTVEAFVQQSGLYDSVWGGKTATGVYVVGRVDDGTYRFVCFL